MAQVQGYTVYEQQPLLFSISVLPGWPGEERAMKKTECSLGCLQVAHLHKDIFCLQKVSFKWHVLVNTKTVHKDNADRLRAFPQEAVMLTDPANSQGPRTSTFRGTLTGGLLKTLQTSGLSMRSD